MTGPGGMDINKMMKQVQQMQADMARVQEELANEIVEASAGGGMVTVTATGSGERKSSASTVRARSFMTTPP